MRNFIPIGKLFNLEKGPLQSTKCTPGEYDFITAAEEWKTHNEYNHECEALVFAAAASGSLGRTHYVDGKFISSDLCFILTPKDEENYPLNLSFYHFVFNSLRPIIVAATKSGTSKESINQTNLKKYELPYFDIEQQDLWIEKLKSTLVRKDLLGSELTHQQTLLKKLRQQILQEAIEGKLTADLPSRQAGWRDKTFKNYSGKWAPKHSKSYFAYVLECEDGTLYKGFTQNIFDRINRHLEGRGAKKTQQVKPICLIHFEEFSTEPEAVEREKYFKSGSGREWLNSLRQERIKENEPASELLQRIQKEKTQLIKEKKIRKQKPLPPTRLPDGQVSEDEKPFDLPEGWVWCQVADIGLVVGGLTKNAAKNSTENFLPYLRVANVYADEIRLNEVKTIGVSENELDKLLLVKNDLLIVEGNGSHDQIGRIAIWDGSIDPCIYQNHLIKLRPLDTKISIWLLRWFLSPSGRRLIEKEARTSTGLYNLSTGKIGKLLVGLPPLSEQKAIVAKVEKLLALCDQLQTQISQNQTHAEQLMQAVLKEAFSQTSGQQNQEKVYSQKTGTSA